MSKTKKTSAKMPIREFVERAIVALRKPGYKGIHVVFSGFNQAFREYYDVEDPRPYVDKLVEEGIIASRPCKGGAMIFLVEDLDPKDDWASTPLLKILKQKLKS